MHQIIHSIIKPIKVFITFWMEKITSNIFDACSQQLLSLYHSLPKLKYPSFERFLDTYDNQNTDISIHPRYTYDSMIQTFSCIQLLIQTITHFKNNHLNFIPITQQITVQSRVKQIYSKILEQNLVDDFEKNRANLSFYWWKM